MSAASIAASAVDHELSATQPAGKRAAASATSCRGAKTPGYASTKPGSSGVPATACARAAS
eukprot:3663388-Lingulodinium_polyedra.AAC.1